MRRTVPRLNPTSSGTRNLKVFHQNYEPAMTFEEIADALHCNRQTVFVIYGRAMEKIRRELRSRPERYRQVFEHEGNT